MDVVSPMTVGRCGASNDVGRCGASVIVCDVPDESKVMSCLR